MKNPSRPIYVDRQVKYVQMLQSQSITYWLRFVEVKNIKIESFVLSNNQ